VDLSSPEIWPERACIHQIDGRCTHVRLDAASTAQLHIRYLHVKTHHTRLFNKLEGGSFEEELYRLLMRYTPWNTIDKTKISTRAQQALSTPLHNMLHNLIGSTTERLASPLNVAMHTSAYWSLHERDRLFGANWNAYYVQWTGASVAIPDHTDNSAAVQAIKWAQQSALQTITPTLTLLVLPANGSGGTDGGLLFLWVPSSIRWLWSGSVSAATSDGGQACPLTGSGAGILASSRQLSRPSGASGASLPLCSRHRQVTPLASTSSACQQLEFRWRQQGGCGLIAC
jgi:hypothetical protein